MSSSLKVGRIAGIPLHFHWTFLGLLLWLLYDSWLPGYGIVWRKLGWLGLLVALIFLSVLLHELGHALAARRFGVNTDKIVLYPIGGGAFLQRVPQIPAQEIWIALAGPLVNFGLAMLVAGWIWLGPNAELQLFVRFFLDPSANIVVLVAPWEHLLVIFFVLNLILGGFNLLPAFPLDGGRVLRAALSYRLPRPQATLLVARLGMIAGAILLMVAYWMGDTFFGIGAFFILSLASVEASVQKRRIRLANVAVKDYVQTDFQKVYINRQTTLAQVRLLVQHLPRDTSLLLLDTWQEPRCVTSLARLLDPELDTVQQQSFLSLSRNPHWLAVHLDDNLLKVAEKLNQHELVAFPVINKYGSIVGLLPTTVITEVLK